MLARPLFTVALGALALALAAGAAAPWTAGTALEVRDVGEVHLVLAVYGFLLPASAAFHLLTLGRVHRRGAHGRDVRLLAAAWATGAGLLAATIAFASGLARPALLGVASALLTVASALTVVVLLRVVPGRGQSVVDVARDPLTKGDDAALTQARFAQFFLVPAVAATTLAGPWWDAASPWAGRAWLAGIHLLLAGHGLVTCYAITHLWVPRLSTVPAIAAGAIKGELHSSLLGLVLLLAGFLAGSKGLAIAGGAFLFLGAFTWMGVLGANIMRNKSRTQRVTPEFTYIPWVFTGVFWLTCGVLLGVFLNAVPATFADHLPGLRFAHAHAAVFGGFAQIGVGLAMRLVPAERRQPPVPFHTAKWSFYAVNLGLAILVAGQLSAAPPGRVDLVGAALTLLGVAACFMTLARHGRRSRS